MARFYELTIAMDETDDGTPNWMVTAPEFPEVTTFADDKQAACVQGLNAIEEAIAARMADGEDIPLPLKETTGKGYFVDIPALSYLKLGLYMLCRKRDISRAELARRLGWHREQVDRLFRLDHKSQLDQIEAAFKALGIPLSMDIPALDAAA
jgi:antitoxin HicB